MDKPVFNGVVNGQISNRQFNGTTRKSYDSLPPSSLPTILNLSNPAESQMKPFSHERVMKPGLDPTIGVENSMKPMLNGNSAVDKNLERRSHMQHEIVIPPNLSDFNNKSSACLPVQQLESLNIHDSITVRDTESVLLLDGSENLKLKSESAFLSELKIEPNKRVKVVSIFGNTGEGKSYTMNEVFFDGKQVFKTSSSQTSCTLGVWAMYDPNLNVICLDTEGLLGISRSENQRTRLLLKVLAVSDIIIYRTRAERLDKGMYDFLGGASKTYKDHFSIALHKALMKTDGDKLLPGLGPGVIIFHETQHTNTLHFSAGVTQSAEDIVRQTFSDLDLTCDAFSFIKYVGVKTSLSFETSFKELKVALHKELESTEVRSARDAKYIYLMLKNLNEKFQNPLTDSNPQQYLSAFFTCPDKCQSCKRGCTLSMGHKDEGEAHFNKEHCEFQHQYQNCVYLCKLCYQNGHKTIVKPSTPSYLDYVLSGYVIDCPKCGNIYRSRQHWYGNKNPEDCAVRIEIVHFWPGERVHLATHSAQKILDGVSVLSDAVASVTSQPTRVLTDWATDQIAPKYWRPNNEIKECHKCRTLFGSSDRKHHCRACGEGFCEGCSSNRMPVPHRGWNDDVRVCDYCFKEAQQKSEQTASLLEECQAEIRPRQIGETLVNGISAVKSVWEIPKELIKDTARPSYWTPDNECVDCVVCNQPFGPTLTLHHCRECGRGVCDGCSKSKKTVPLYGWHTPARVCDKCYAL